VNQLQFLGSMLIGGGLIALVISIFIALFISAEFDSGFIKNVFTARTSRASFFASKFIVIIAIVAIFSLVGIGASLACSSLAGFNISAVPLSELALWSGLVILTISALSMLVSLLVWFFRGKVVGVLAAVFLSSGLIMSIVKMFLSLIPSLSHVVDYTLFGCWSALSQGLDVAGSLSSPHIALVGGGFLVLYSILSYLTIKKKDV
jgi:ABC-2 type transport system permease protein